MASARRTRRAGLSAPSRPDKTHCATPSPMGGKPSRLSHAPRNVNTPLP